MTATASPNLTDQSILAGDPTFQARVREAVIATCFQIVNESITAGTLSAHLKRANFAVQTLTNILNNPTLYSVFFANCVATDATTIAAATASGTIPLTTGNVAAQAATIPDVDITAALASQWGAFFVS